MNMIKLFGKPIRVNRAAQDQENTDTGANLFVGNLDPQVDEKLLYDTFSPFGHLISTPKVRLLLLYILGLCSIISSFALVPIKLYIRSQEIQRPLYQKDMDSSISIHLKHLIQSLKR